MTSQPAHGLFMVYTGDGKGKTTAALGMVFRALGYAKKVAVVQYIKGKWQTGERRFAADLPGLTFEAMGEGFTWDSDDLSTDRAAAAEAWRRSQEYITSGEYDLVVLDELTFALNYDFIKVEEVLATLQARPATVHVLATGRKAPKELLAAADLVTEMQAVKHPFKAGIKAQAGVDF